MPTKIEWVGSDAGRPGETWNPITGCSPKSEGCRSCYAARMAKRLAGRFGYPADDPFRVTFHPDRLDQPTRWKTPRRIFVCSMGDLFHKDVPFDWIARVWDIMWRCPQHTFIVLTKRVGRMARFVSNCACELSFGWTARERVPIERGDYHHLEDIFYRNECGWARGNWECEHPANDSGECHSCDCPIASEADSRADLEAIGVADEYNFDDEGLAADCEWMTFRERPRNGAAANVWLGFTAENQARYKQRIQQMRRLRVVLGPYFVLFASLEPMLGPIALNRVFSHRYGAEKCYFDALAPRDYSDGGGSLQVPTLNWVIAGGETGPGARPSHPDWFRAVRDQCQAAGVPFFFKSWGDWVPTFPFSRIGDVLLRADGRITGSISEKTTQTFREPWPPNVFGFSTQQQAVGETIARTVECDARLGDEYTMGRVGKHRAGRLLDGHEHKEWPGGL